METSNELIKILLGDTLTINMLKACYIFSLLGAVLHWLVDTNKGIKKSVRSPNKFSLGYWLQNNFVTKIKSLLAAVIVIYISLRFADLSAFPDMPIYVAAFLIGGSIDWVIKQISDKFKK